jgi:signal peptidase I
VATPEQAARRRRLPFLRDLIVVVVLAVLASFLIKTFLIQSFFIPSASMENTLRGDPGHDDRILVDRLVPAAIPLQRGDVVVFTDPGGWLRRDGAQAPASPAPSPLQRLLNAVNPLDPGDDDHLVKRLIGLPGDRVACCDARGRMSVNGVPLDEPYVRLPKGVTAVSRTAFDEVVPDGRLWVMGDNRYDSADSRYNRDTPSKGFVPVSDVVGRAFVISWPVSRWRWLSSWPDTFTRVPSPTPARSTGRAHPG